jgi:hypothetical protein
MKNGSACSEPPTNVGELTASRLGVPSGAEPSGVEVVLRGRCAARRAA